MRDKILSIIAEALENLDANVPETMDENTVLLGNDGILDSVGLVNMVIDVEEAVNDEFHSDLTLADVRAMSQKNSPFRSVGSLADYIMKCLEESE